MVLNMENADLKHVALPPVRTVVKVQNAKGHHVENADLAQIAKGHLTGTVIAWLIAVNSSTSLVNSWITLKDAVLNAPVRSNDALNVVVVLKIGSVRKPRLEQPGK